MTKSGNRNEGNDSVPPKEDSKMSGLITFAAHYIAYDKDHNQDIYSSVPDKFSKKGDEHLRELAGKWVNSHQAIVDAWLEEQQKLHGLSYLSSDLPASRIKIPG